MYKQLERALNKKIEFEKEISVYSVASGQYQT